MPLTLSWSAATSLPVDGESLRPDALSGLSADEVARVRLPVGNGSAEVGELFRVEGDLADGHLVLVGDLRKVRAIGRGMTSGRLTIRGAAGSRLGAGMTGGTIEVDGSAGDWAGAEMRGGLLRIRGPAGDGLGAALPGSRLGMREGVILVEGTAGADVGLAMRRGLIAVLGPVGDGLGRAMIAGSIFAFGPVGRAPGSGMRRGMLALLGPESPEVPPTFRPSGRIRPPFMDLYLRQLREWGFPLADSAAPGPFARYNGDLLAKGQGEILIRA
jgi:formylmethanofuran dehydrogenase subunit C